MTYSYMWRDSFICVTRLSHIHVSNVNEPLKSRRERGQNDVWDMTHGCDSSYHIHHVTRINESCPTHHWSLDVKDVELMCRTCECVISHESCHMYQWVISHTWLKSRRGKRQNICRTWLSNVNASYHTYHVIRINESCPTHHWSLDVKDVKLMCRTWLANVNASYHTYHVIRINESCPTHHFDLSHV